MRNLRTKAGHVLYPELSYRINGIIFETKKQVGIYGSESQYGDIIEKLLKTAGLSYEREKVLPIAVDGEKIGRHKADFVIDNKIILEIKAKNILTKNDYYQAKRYLVASGCKLAILVNMRQYTVMPKRILSGFSS